MDKWCRWLICGCLLAAAGCVDQKREVARYRKLLDTTQTATSQPAEFPPDKPLSLRAAVDLANAYNERLNLRGEAYLQAIIDKHRAASAFQPTISLSPSYFQQASVPASEGTPNRVWNVPITGQANLFNGFSDLARYRSAGDSISQQKALLLDAQAQLMIDVATTYYQVLRSEHSVQVLKNSLAVQRERVRDIDAKQKAGLARPLDVFQTQADEAATRVSLNRTVSDVINGRTVLAFLIDVSVRTNPLVDELEPKPLVDIAALQHEAQVHRLDLAAAKWAVAAARQNVKAAFGEYWPSVSLNTSFFFHKESTPTNSPWFYMISGNLPIFSAGVIDADVRTALSQLRQAELSQSLLSRQIVQDTQVACDNLHYVQQQITDLRTQLTAADQAYQQADTSYKVGLATNLERLIAQDQLLSTQLQLTSAEFDRKVAYLNLMRITGELVSPRSLPPTTQPVVDAATHSASGG